MASEVDFHRRIVRITEDYFGPAAPRYINRLIVNHCHKVPGRLTAKDLPELIKWARLTMAMLTEDEKTVQEFINRLSELKNGSKVNAGSV